MAKGDSIDLRKKNKRNIILNTIKNNKFVSRSAIKTISKFSMTTVLQSIDELMKKDLIYEAGVGESTGGRKPVWVKINPEGAYFIGAEFNANYVTGAILNLKSEIVHTNKIIIKGKKDKDHVINAVKSCINGLINYLNDKKDRIVGIGIGVPGFVDKKKGMDINYVHVSEWKNIPIKDVIEKEFGIRTFVESNIKAMALGFKWYKYDKGIKSILFVSIRTGAGMGCIINNEVLDGRNNAAGEIGHIFVSDNKNKCKCGMYGCLDTEVGYDAIKQKILSGIEKGGFKLIKDIIGDNTEKLDIGIFVEAVNKGDADSINLLKESCKYIGRAVGYAIMMFDPDKVVFSGDVTTAQGFIEYITEEINKICLSEIRTGLIIELSGLGDRIGGIGAAAIVMQEEFGFTAKPV